MNKILRKLFISIITVVIAIGALGTTTFAWFTLTNVASISNFQAQVRSEQGIEISLDGENWVNTLSSTDIWEQLEKDGFTRFNHITSADGKTFQTLTDKNVLEAATSGFISLRLYFRAINIETISLTNLTLEGDEFSWNVDTKFLAKPGLTVDPKSEDDNIKKLLVNSADAIRISLVSYNDEVLGDLIDAYELADSGTNTYIPDWDSQDSFPVYGAYSYYVAKRAVEPAGWADKSLVKTIALTDSPITPLEILTFEDNETTHEIMSIQINIWFEGYDPEGYNALLNKAVRISFEFSGDE